MLANKIKIPGLGHRVYHTLDPRAAFLKDMAKELGERTGHIKLYEISNAIQAYTKQAKNLNANVDFFSASTYYSLGIPVDLFTPIFAVSRMSGWTAHMLEQYHNNRLIRPRADYIGAGARPPGLRASWVDHRQIRSTYKLYDLSFFRNNLDAIAKRLADRGFTLDVEAFRKLDTERRAALAESEQLKARSNAESQEIGKLKKAGQDTSELQQKVRDMADRMAALEQKAEAPTTNSAR